MIVIVNFCLDQFVKLKPLEEEEETQKEIPDKRERTTTKGRRERKGEGCGT